MARRKEGINMKRNALAVFLLAAIVIAAGACSTVQEGADPFIVRTQQAVAASFDVIDLFLNLEHSNSELFEQAVPGVHAAAEKMRVEGPQKFQAIERAIDAYKAAPSDGAKVEIDELLAFIQSLANDAKVFILKWGEAAGGGS